MKNKPYAVFLTVFLFVLGQTAYAQLEKGVTSTGKEVDCSTINPSVDKTVSEYGKIVTHPRVTRNGKIITEECSTCGVELSITDTVTCVSITLNAAITAGDPTAAVLKVYSDAAHNTQVGSDITATIAGTTITAVAANLNCYTRYYFVLEATEGTGTCTFDWADSTRDMSFENLTTCTVGSVRALGIGTDLSHEHGYNGSTNQIDSVYDHEGNAYAVVQIGEQCWLKENMRATTRPSGTSILQVPYSDKSLSSPRAYYYENDINNYYKYGCLYNFPAAMDIDDLSTSFPYPHRGICPEGWHVPSDADWTTLATNAGVGVTTGTGAGKLAGGCDWVASPSTTAPGNYSYSDRNATSFYALPAAGCRDGVFNSLTAYANFWSTLPEIQNQAYYRDLSYEHQYMGRLVNPRSFAYSVRCVRDVECESLPDVSVVVSDNIVSIETPEENVDYSWDNGTAGTSTTYSTYPADGVYTHTVTATNIITGCKTVYTFNMCDIATSISLNDDLNIAYCADQYSTEAAEKVFTATPTPAGSYTYTWTVDGVTQSSTTNTMSYTFSDVTTGLHIIGVSVAGASTSGESYVTVYELPTISVASGSATQSVCKGAAIENVTFATANGTAAIDGTSNGLTLTGNVLSGTPTADCNFNVKVSGEHGCTSATQAISITRLDTATLTVEGEKDRSICAGESLTINFTSNTTFSASQVPAGMSFSGTALSGTPTATGTYTITTTGLNSCGTKSITGTVTVNALPVVSIATTDSKTAICAGENITLTATSGFSSYTWSNAGSSTNTQTVSPSTETTYTVTVSNGTCTNTASQTITVNALPTVTISGAEEMCAGATGNTLTANATPAGTYSYQWKKDGADITSANNATYAVTESGSYTVAATNTSTGCSNTSSAKTVTIQNPAISSVSISANPGTSICEGSSTTLTATPSGNNGTVTYSWSTGSTNSAISVSAADTYTVTATVKMGNCTSAAVTATQAVSVSPQPIVTLSPASQSVCSGTPISPITITPSYATVSSVTGLPDGVTRNENTISGTPTTAGTYTVTVTVNSTNGCGTNTGTANITVTPGHTLSDLSLASQSVCQNSAITPITFTSTNATVSAASLPTGVSLTHTGDNYTISGTPTASGTFNYTVTAASSYSCGANLSKSGTITVNPQPVATISSNTGKFAICKNDNITLSVPTTAGATYSWSDGTNSNSNSSWTVAPTTTTTYNVTVSLNSCSAVASKQVTVNELPAVAISSSNGDAVCDGSTTTLTANASNCTYKWDYQNKTTQTITPTITATTTYTVTVTHTSTGCKNSASKEITMKSKPTIALADISNTAICTGDNTTLTATPSGSYNTVTYRWSPSTGLNSTTAQTVTASPTATTTYTVTATAESADGCTQTASKSVTVTVNALPAVTSISGNTAFCEGSNTTLSVPSISGASYHWSNNATTNSITVTEAGNYAVTVTNSNNCVKAVPAVTVTKNSLPTITVADINLCSGQTATFTATNVTSGATVSWSTTETGCSLSPTTGTTTNLTYPSGAGTYTVTATATTAAGCASSDNATATITSPNAGTLTLTADASTICNGATTTLRASVSGNDGTVQSYTWYKDNVVISGATSNTYTTPALSATATYKCEATIKDGDCTAKTAAKTQTITVLSPAITSVSIAANPTEAVVCNGASVTLTASAQGTGTMSYVWSTGETNNQIVVAPSVETTYTVTATATSTANGVTCTATSNTSKTVTVYNPVVEGVVASASADSICPGGTVYLAVDVENSNGTLSYQWKKNGANISGATSDAYVISAAETSDTYTCVVTATDGSCTASVTTAELPVVVRNYQLDLEILTPTAELNLCGDGTKELVFATVLKDATSDNKEVSDVTYTWSAGSPSLNHKYDTLTVTRAGNYTISVTASIDGCSSITQSTIATVTDVNEEPAVLLCEDLRNNGFSVDKVFNGTSKVSPWTGYTFKWYKDGSDEAVATGESMSYNGTTIDFGNYYCEVTSPHGCKALSNVATLSLPIAGKKATPAPCDVKNLGLNEHTDENGKLVWVSDHEGNEYSVVQIGDQCWLRENMRCTTLPSGREMPKISSTNVDIYQRTAAYFGFVGDYPTTSQSTILNGHTYPDSIFVKYYGYNYNWAAAMDTTDFTQFATQATTHMASNGNNIAFRNRRGICPEGWHLPTDEEFFTMLLAAGVADEKGFTSTSEHGHNANVLTTSCDWNTSTADNAPGNYEEFDRNSTYFSALPNGYWWTDGLGQYGRFWTATASKLQTHSGNEQDQVSAWEVELQNSTQQYTRNYRPRWHAYAVRCLRDGVPEITKCAVENLNIRETLDESGDSIVSVADHEGNVYQVVQIGEQCWLKENLRTLSSPSTGVSYIDADGSFDINTDAKCAIYDGGALYKWWAAVDIPDGDARQGTSITFDNPPQGICPQGWHLPSKAEFETLIAQVQDSRHVGSELAGGNTWKSTTNASCPGDYTYALRNSTKFSASADGRLDGSTLKEYNEDAYLWSSTQYSNQIAWSLNLDYNEKKTGGGSMTNGYDLQTHDASMRLGFSVRCVRDLTPSASTPYLKLNASTPQAKVCDNGGSTSVTYTAELTLVPATNYDWTVDGVADNSSHTNTLVREYTGTGNHTVTCTATYNASTDPLVEAGSATASVNTAVVTGGKAPVIGLCTEYNPLNHVELMSQNNSNCVLDWGDGSATVTVARNEHPDHIYAERGEYTISLTNEDGCTATRNVKFDMLTPCTVTTIGGNEIHRDGEASGTISYVKDHEDNQYRVVQIGNQCWLAENLRTTTSPTTHTYLVNPGNVPENSNQHTASNVSKAAHWFLNNQTEYGYLGLMYNWCAAMDTCRNFSPYNNDEIATTMNVDNQRGFSINLTLPRRGICPEGWHIPSREEFETLRHNTQQVNWQTGAAYLTGSCLWEGVDGDIYRQGTWTNARNTTQTYPNSYANPNRDMYGFSALPAGEVATNGRFQRLYIATSIWSSSVYNNWEVWYLFIGDDVGYNQHTAMKHNGQGNNFSVRCVRND